MADRGRSAPHPPPVQPLAVIRAEDDVGELEARGCGRLHDLPGGEEQQRVHQRAHDSRLASTTGPAGATVELAMKFHATVVFEFNASDVGEAGTRLNELLQQAEERELATKSLELSTPHGTPVSLPPARA
jgi:hypothetical protein